jgi:hypothetical protein
MDKISIENLERYEVRGWMWQIVSTNWIGEKSVKHYHTNELGDGLWCDDTQHTGTCQFSLTDNKHNNYNRIRRYFTEPDLA